MLKSIAKIAAVITLALSVAVPASAGSLASQGLADPVVVHCDDAAKNTVKVHKPAGGRRCIIDFVQDDIDWLYSLPPSNEDVKTYIGAYLKGKFCAIPAKWDARRAKGLRAFQVPSVYPWDKKCGSNAAALVRGDR
jgi:hypothetical protein